MSEYDPISVLHESGVILKLKRFFHLSGWSFGLNSYIGLEYISLVLSLKIDL